MQAESADPVVRSASFNDTTGVFTVPGRTSAVFLQARPVQDQIDLLQHDVQALLENGDLERTEARYLQEMLSQLEKMLEKGNNAAAETFIQNFIRRVEQLQRRGRLSDEHAEDLLASAEAILSSL